MKKNESCPKCKRNNVIGAFLQDESTGIKVQIGGEFHDHKISRETYICLDCGYIENYASDRDIIRIREYLRLKGELP